MIKEIKELLKNSNFTIKSKSGSTWYKENFNLVDYVKENKISIRKSNVENDYYCITYNNGRQVLKTYCYTPGIEENLYLMIAQNCTYLGYDFKLITRLRNYNLTK